MLHCCHFWLDFKFCRKKTSLELVFFPTSFFFGVILRNLEKGGQRPQNCRKGSTKTPNPRSLPTWVHWKVEFPKIAEKINQLRKKKPVEIQTGFFFRNWFFFRKFFEKSLEKGDLNSRNQLFWHYRVPKCTQNFSGPVPIRIFRNLDLESQLVVFFDRQIWVSSEIPLFDDMGEIGQLFGGN